MDTLEVKTVDDIAHILKELLAKNKKGLVIEKSVEYNTLLTLCAIKNKALNTAACKAVYYLITWEIISAPITISFMITKAIASREVFSIVNIVFRLAIDSLKSSTEFNATDCIRDILRINDRAVFLVVSCLEELDQLLLDKVFRHVIHDMLFVPNTNREFVWRRITAKVDNNLHRCFLYWLQYTNLEDCSLALYSLKSTSLSCTERCYHLASMINHSLTIGILPKEEIECLMGIITATDSQTQSIIMLSIMFEMNNYPKQLCFIIFDICDWFLDHTRLVNDVLWVMLLKSIPLARKNFFAPEIAPKAQSLISKLNVVLNNKASNRMSTHPIKEPSNIYDKYAINRHHSLKESYMTLRLLAEFNSDVYEFKKWLKSLLCCPNAAFLQIPLSVYFLKGDVDVRRKCFMVLTKLEMDNAPLFMYQMHRETDPRMQLQILKSMFGMKNGAHITDPLLQQIQDSQDHSNTFNIATELCRASWGLGNDFDRFRFIFADKQTEKDALCQIAFMKTVVTQTDIYTEEVIPFANNIINSYNRNGGSLATALAIDIITILCEKKILKISLFWNQFMRLISGDTHPAVHESVCNFLSRVPVIMKGTTDTDFILYKSARLLWYFVVQSDKFNKAVAIRSLQNYDLEHFDCSFLPLEKSKKQRSTGIQKIEGNCWMDLLCDKPLVELFVHFVNKARRSNKSAFNLNYASLFHGTIAALRQELSNSSPIFFSSKQINANKVIRCLKILSADWVRVPSDIELNQVGEFLSYPSIEITNLALYVIMKFSIHNESAETMLEKYLKDRCYGDREMATMILLPSHLLTRYRENNMDILMRGLFHGLSTDDVDYATGKPLEGKVIEAFTSCAGDESASASCRRMIMMAMMKLWLREPFGSDVMETILHIIAKTLASAYSKPLLKILPECPSNYEVSLKYINLCKEVAINRKSLYSFDPALKLGMKRKSLQSEVLSCFVSTLNQIGQHNKPKSIRWFSRFLSALTMFGDDFLCQIVVYVVNYLTDYHILNLSNSLREHLDLFPMAINRIVKIEGMSALQMLSILTTVLSNRVIHPVFAEAFFFSILLLRDDPSVQYFPDCKEAIEASMSTYTFLGKKN